MEHSGGALITDISGIQMHDIITSLPFGGLSTYLLVSGTLRQYVPTAVHSLGDTTVEKHRKLKECALFTFAVRVPYA